MTAAWPLDEIAPPAPVPRLLVELPSRPRVFFSNLRDLVFPRRLPPLELHSAPAQFWPDVFVTRPLPWARFLQSVVYHVVALRIADRIDPLLSLCNPASWPMPAFDHSQVIYYQPSEYLPPLDTRTAQSEQPEKADPEFSRQPIISLPRRGGQSITDHRHATQRQAEERRSPAQHRGVVRQAGEAAARHSRCLR